MSDEFREMDDWSEKQVATFKYEATYQSTVAMPRALERADGDEKMFLVAEGDSWFDYPPSPDVIDCLRRNHGYSIDRFSKAGDTLENMIYGTKIKKDFTRREPSINDVLRRLGETKPFVFLFSGGGNDIAGDEFGSFVNHNGSSLPPLRTDYIEYMVHTVFSKYYTDLIAKVAAVTPDTFIVTHGYGHTLPSGEGVDFFGWNFAGPWLRPALTMKDHLDPIQQRDAVFTMIDEFNDMLFKLDQAHEKFIHVDLRDEIDPDTDWANELHLKRSRFAHVSKVIHERIQSL